MDWDPGEYVWKQVADVIRQRVKDGQYRPRAPIPSEIRMAEELGVAKEPSAKQSHTYVTPEFSTPCRRRGPSSAPRIARPTTTKPPQPSSRLPQGYSPIRRSTSQDLAE